MDTKNNHLQYLQVIHHHIFLQVVLFLLLPGPDSGLDGVLFDDGRKDMPLDDYVNVIFIILLVLLMTCSSPRRPLFLHALSFECTSKLCGTFLNQFSDYFHI